MIYVLLFFDDITCGWFSWASSWS